MVQIGRHGDELTQECDRELAGVVPGLCPGRGREQHRGTAGRDRSDHRSLQHQETTLTLPSFAWAQSLDETDDRRSHFSVHRVVEDVVVRAGELAEL